jgi:hypothetical protein
MKNRLAYNRGYLCGAMDRADDGGIGWRAELQRQLVDLKIFWLDPTNKPIDIGIEDLASRDKRRHEKQIGDFDSVVSEMKPIRCVDLRMVDISDFLIVNLDMTVHATGTYEEVFLANREKKPIIVRVEQGKEECPDWLFGTIPHEMIFSTWPEVYNYLSHVAFDPNVNTFGRWFFFNFTGDNNAHQGRG